MNNELFNNNVKEININDIIFREDLYPRIKHKQELIEKYANSIKMLPPISINQNYILIDGFHRLKAHQLEQKEKIKVEIIKTESERELKKLAYKYNSNHGYQLTNEDKRKYAIEMVEFESVKEIANILSISESIITKWTQGKREAIKEDRNNKIIELYLRAWNTQEKIAELMNVEQKTISNIIENFRKNNKITEITEITNNFKLLLYTVWNINKKDKETSHYGYFPEIFMENLLYYHTKLFDIVYDPFAGSGTTIDICQKWYRRYYCSDRIVKPGREKDMKQWNILNGLPNDLQKPDFVFLDPPYSIIAKNKYSDDKEDLSNMNINEFFATLKVFISELTKRKIKKIALIISPIQYTNENHKYLDCIFKIDKFFNDKYEIEMRYFLPYSTEQYNGTQVEIMKKGKKAICINRDLVIWRFK